MARKLVREMEDHKVSRAEGVSVRNRFTVFLCPEDYERLRARMETLADKLERHLAKHVRTKKYLLPGDISVDIVADVDLKLGHFGILAERDAPGLVERGPAEQAGRRVPVRAREEEPAAWFDESPAPVRRPGTERVRPKRPTQNVASGESAAGRTAVIGAADAGALDLAWQTIVFRTARHEREFTKGRVIVGRAKEADFRIDDPNVSRRHAVVFWSDGKVMLEDLDSTNGTMVNGRPVSISVIQPGDVVMIGDCRIIIETR